jgi:transcriptional regulator with XRE-family HTH domain
MCAMICVMMGKDGSSHMNTDKDRRAGLREFRKVLELKQEELAALAGVSLETVAEYERGRPVSYDTDARICGAIFSMLAKKNPEAVNHAVQPALEMAEQWEKVLLLEPESDAALELEKQTGKILAELKAQAETLTGFLRSGANIAVSLTK